MSRTRGTYRSNRQSFGARGWMSDIRADNHHRSFQNFWSKIQTKQTKPLTKSSNLKKHIDNLKLISNWKKSATLRQHFLSPSSRTLLCPEEIWRMKYGFSLHHVHRSQLHTRGYFRWGKLSGKSNYQPSFPCVKFATNWKKNASNYLPLKKKEM